MARLLMPTDILLVMATDTMSIPLASTSMGPQCSGVALPQWDEAFLWVEAEVEAEVVATHLILVEEAAIVNNFTHTEPKLGQYGNGQYLVV